MHLENVIVLLQALVLLLVLGQCKLLPSDFIPEARHLVAHNAHIPLDLHHFFLETQSKISQGSEPLVMHTDTTV